jgi:hypothetical protein
MKPLFRTSLLQTSVTLSLLLSVSIAVRGADTKDPKIVAVSADSTHPKLIYVLFDRPYPDPGDIGSKENWIVFVKQKKGIVTKLEVQSVDPTALDPKSPNEKSAILTLDSPMPLDTVTADVTLVNAKYIVHVTGSNLLQSGAPTQAPFKSCTAKNDCDVYVTGSYTASSGGTPLYAIDSFAGYMHSINEKKYYGKLGFYGQVQQKSASNINPDSALGYLVYQYVLNEGAWFGPFAAPVFNYRVAGFEYGKTGDNLNFVTSPVVTFPIRLSGTLTRPVGQGITFPLLGIQLGTEFVDVKKSALAPTGTWHTRGLIGATFAAGIPIKKPFLYSLQLTSSYQLRLPSAPEIYYDSKFAPVNASTGKVGTTPPRLGTQPRNYVDTKLTYNVIQSFGFTFEYSYGSQPPSFVVTHNTYALGLSFSLAETSWGRYSILRP